MALLGPSRSRREVDARGRTCRLLYTNELMRPIEACLCISLSINRECRESQKDTRADCFAAPIYPYKYKYLCCS